MKKIIKVGKSKRQLRQEERQKMDKALAELIVALGGRYMISIRQGILSLEYDREKNDVPKPLNMINQGIQYSLCGWDDTDKVLKEWKQVENLQTEISYTILMAMRDKKGPDLLYKKILNQTPKRYKGVVEQAWSRVKARE